MALKSYVTTTKLVELAKQLKLLKQLATQLITSYYSSQLATQVYKIM